MFRAHVPACKALTFPQPASNPAMAELAQVHERVAREMQALIDREASPLAQNRNANDRLGDRLPALSRDSSRSVDNSKNGLVLLRHKPLRPRVFSRCSTAAWAARQTSYDSGDEPSAHGRD
jgi:hypothetical protein